ncbi:MAG TPA: peptidoglycan-binding domain-containing protein [Vineibacter sp.]|nr:peptidoglycan-binding domain-containing protein [Vineibacter sp.]
MVIPSNVIRGSVGLGGVNQRADVQLVQRLLNAVPQAKGGPQSALTPDGQCGPMTNAAIRQFQAKNLVGMAADGRVDPGGRTEQALLALLNTLGVLAKLLAGGGGGAPAPATPVVTGASSPIRQRFMAICRELLPPQGQLTNGQRPALGTACGEFPGRVFTRVPVLLPSQPGAFKMTVPKIGLCYLTSPMTQWKEFAETVDAKYAPVRTWVPFAGNRPLPGDIYVLGNYDKPTEFQHVGVIVNAQGNEWLTADGGQGNGGQSGFMKRQFQPSGQIEGEFGNKAVLWGWVNLDALYAVAIAAFPKNL